MPNNSAIKKYLSFDEKLITDFSDSNINELYNKGYVFTRTSKGAMYQTRSLRIDLNVFRESSENRRVLKKTEEILFSTEPIPYSAYDWSIGKLAKDFYTTKFGDGTFSANKIKELITDKEKTNFNKLFVYSFEDKKIGYCIASETNELVHYCYPFYELQPTTPDVNRDPDHRRDYQLPPNLGLGMMLKAILYANEQGKKYVYLGSAQRPSDTYKLQFSGLEWFDGITWKHDLDELKNILK